MSPGRRRSRSRRSAGPRKSATPPATETWHEHPLTHFGVACGPCSRVLSLCELGRRCIEQRGQGGGDTTRHTHAHNLATLRVKPARRRATRRKYTREKGPAMAAAAMTTSSHRPRRTTRETSGASDTLVNTRRERLTDQPTDRPNVRGGQYCREKQQKSNEERRARSKQATMNESDGEEEYQQG